MFKMTDFPATPAGGNAAIKEAMEANAKLTPAVDEVTLDSASVAVAVTLACYKTTLKSAVAGAKFDLPDGGWVGQEKLLVADVSGSGTCVASTAALAKLQKLGMFGESVASISALSMTADGKGVLLKWCFNNKWNIIDADATIS